MKFIKTILAALATLAGGMQACEESHASRGS
jgi:hypothetical protein